MGNVLKLPAHEVSDREALEKLVKAAQRACCVQTALEYVYFTELLRKAVEEYTGENWTRWKC